MTQNSKRVIRIVMPVAVVLTLALAVPAYAQRGGGGGGRAGGGARGSAAVGTAVPRAGAVPFRGYGYGGYRGYGWYGGYGGLYFGFGYPGFYGAWGYPWYGYPYPYYGYAAFGYPYGVAAQPYGSVRIDLPQKDAQVYADGYFAGSVDNFDGRFHHLNLGPGPHKLEIRAAGFEPITFDVNVEPGQTITYRAAMRPAQS